MIKELSIRSFQQRMAEGVPEGRLDESSARRLWWAALETLQTDILVPMNLKEGFWFASPLPALYESKLIETWKGWVWAPDEFDKLRLPLAGLLPSASARSIQQKSEQRIGEYKRLKLREEDGFDPFLMIITPEVQVALALHGKETRRNLLFRSDHETLIALLEMLDLRLNDESPKDLIDIREEILRLDKFQNNDSIEKSFWPLLSQRLTEMMPSLTLHTFQAEKDVNKHSNNAQADISLLEAITHEVRTPLATIRTLIRSLLKKNNLPQVVVNRLKQIDSECTEQIDRFGLIFNAAELQRVPNEQTNLASTNLGSMLEMLHPGWSQQLERRGVSLHLDITPDLPFVLSDPERLELMLGGLIDRSIRGIKPGGRLLLELRPAGNRLKLQLLRESKSSQDQKELGVQSNSELGPVLSWNPSTGSLQLSQEATQRLFASLGGRLAQRKDSALIVFFPIVGSKF